MYPSIKEIIETLWIPTVLSLFGGFVRLIRFGVKGWKAFLGSLLCSAFAGIIVHWSLKGRGLDVELVSAIIAVSGYCGGILLDSLQARLIRGVEDMPFLPIPRKWDGSERRKEKKRLK